jgi:hypothetical protein
MRTSAVQIHSQSCTLGRGMRSRYTRSFFSGCSQCVCRARGVGRRTEHRLLFEYDRHRPRAQQACCEQLHGRVVHLVNGGRRAGVTAIVTRFQTRACGRRI